MTLCIYMSGKLLQIQIIIFEKHFLIKANIFANKGIKQGKVYYQK